MLCARRCYKMAVLHLCCKGKMWICVQTPIECNMTWTPWRSLKRWQLFGPFTKEVAKKMMYKVAHGVDWLHNHNIVHRDLKASNGLVRVNTIGIFVLLLITNAKWEIMEQNSSGPLKHCCKLAKIETEAENQSYFQKKRMFKWFWNDLLRMRFSQ